jgi:predicted amidohydrolase
MIICFDGDYPELARITAVRGAEILLRPSALLRSADVWELTNRARAYDNHVYVVGANCTGTDPAGTLYFGNSMIVTPVAEVVARAASHECWVSARLDPATAMASLTPGSSVPQVFDHLADRNLDLLRRYADDLVRPARTSFPHPEPGSDLVD